MAVSSFGFQMISPVPRSRRGRPTATYTIATGHQRRSPWRMPSWPPMIVSGMAVSPTSDAVARLSSLSRAFTTGVSASSTTPTTTEAR